MKHIAVTVIGTNLVFDYGTEDAAREAMSALETEDAPWDCDAETCENEDGHHDPC